MERAKTAVVTGANGGIGRALVKRFAEAGYYVVGTDLVVPNDFKGHTFVSADLCEVCANGAVASEFFAAVRSSIAPHGLDVLINNAALQVLGALPQITLNEWRKVMDINVTAPFFLVQQLFAELSRARGSVINISSIHSELTKPGFISYAASKSALTGLTRALAIDVGGHIRVNAIAPAAIGTAMLEAGFADKPEAYEKLKAYHPAQRLGTPDEVADLALMLASSNLPFLNGAVVNLDGGISARLHDPA